MTRIRIGLRVDQADGSRIPAAGRVEWSRTQRRTVDGDAVLPTAFVVPLTADDPEPVVDVAPTGDGWAWRVAEYALGGITRHVLVPESDDVLDYATLVDVDPATLSPTVAPVGAWWAALDEVRENAGGALPEGAVAAAVVAEVAAQGLATVADVEAAVSAIPAGVTPAEVETTVSAALATLPPSVASAELDAVAAQIPLTTVHPAGQGLAAALRSGERSACLTAIGDSTTTGSNGFVALLALALAGTTHTVVHRAWDRDANTWLRYNALATVAGPERGVRLNGETLVYPATVSGDTLDVAVRVTPDSWAAGAQTLIAQWDTATAARSWCLTLTSTGMLQLSTSSDGSATHAPAHVSTVAVPFEAGQPGWVRAVFRGDNGAGGRETIFYTSTDGGTWTQLGTTRTNTTPVTLFASPEPISLGSRRINSIWFDKLVGVIHLVEVRATTGGRNLAPVLPDGWDVGSIDPSKITWQGAPVLLVLNGGAAGRNIGYHLDPAWTGTLLGPTASPDLTIVNEGHNNSGYSAAAWRHYYAAFLAALRAAVGPYTPILALDQNPVRSATVASGSQSGFSPGAYATREQRATASLAVAATAGAGIYPLSVRPAFTDGPTYAATIRNDGLHQTTAADTPGGGSGHEVQARYLARLLGSSTP